MGCMEMSHSALAIYYKAVQATPQIPLLFYNFDVLNDDMSRKNRFNSEKIGDIVPLIL